MPKKGIYNNLELKALIKELRNNSTAAESALWEQLRVGRLCGIKWRRQVSIGNYIVDFYCPKAHICIELDGHEHYTMQGDTRDYDRTVFLNSNGIKVLRFENREIWEDINRVLETIKIELGFD